MPCQPGSHIRAKHTAVFRQTHQLFTSGMWEVEIRDDWKEQGFAEVHRVMVKTEAEVVPTNTLFLTFKLNTSELLKEIMVGYLKVKVTMFVPNPMRCYNHNKFGNTSQCCKVAAKCQWCGKDQHEGQCEGHKMCSNCNGSHTSSAQDCPVWKRKREIQHVRIEKHISFPEATQLVEAKMLSVISDGKSYCTIASTKKEVLST